MDVYVARQAVFNVNREVIRNSFSVIGLDKVTQGKRAFINFDEDLIKSDIIELLPNESITIESLENVKPSKQIIHKLWLKSKSYK
jgi:EAL and modified HD-GYP domain-containing signal transduction protein